MEHFALKISKSLTAYKTRQIQIQQKKKQKKKDTGKRNIDFFSEIHHFMQSLFLTS